jgi:glycosyltransferase involved in cell wall biosynthesis
MHRYLEKRLRRKRSIASATATSPSAVRAAAVVVLRNEITHIDGLIRYLVLEGLDIVAIDNQSDDGSAERVREWLGCGVLDVQERQFAPIWSMRNALRWKFEVAAELEHDWFVHVDADEWLHPSCPGDRLVDLFARAEAAGSNAVNFEDFTFVPDEPLEPGADPRERFRSYYYFAPAQNRLMRAWRRGSGLSSIETGGHVLYGEHVRVHTENAVLRHYPLLSPEHLHTKYQARHYDPANIKRGWHHDRIGLRIEDLSLEDPAIRRLSRWDSREFDRSVPVNRHIWQPGELTLTPAG